MVHQTPDLLDFHLSKMIISIVSFLNSVLFHPELLLTLTPSLFLLSVVVSVTSAIYIFSHLGEAFSQSYLQVIHAVTN